MQQQQRSTWREKLRHAPLGIKIGLGIGAAITSCCILSAVCASSLVVLGTIVGPIPTQRAVAQTPVPSAVITVTAAATTTVTATTATTSPTSTPLPSPTPTPVVVTTARLGGPDSAFYAAYGYQADDLFQVGTVTFSINKDLGSDGKQHTFEMLAYPSDASLWTLDQARNICPAFLPPDATLSKQSTDNEGNPQYQYISPQLVGTFASSSPWYDPTGLAVITFVIRNGGVFQCDMATFN